MKKTSIADLKVGKLSRQLNDIVQQDLPQKANQADLELQTARIDNLSTLQQGSTTGDAELIDARVGADGTTYQNVGSALRNVLNAVISDNLYDTSYAIDGKLINNDPTNPSLLLAYANGILSGYVPFKEGEIKTFTNGNGLYIGAVCFFDKDKKAVCGIDRNGAAYGTWSAITGKVSMTWNKDVITMTNQTNSKIAYAVWYITTTTTSNYYGTHTGLTGIIDNVQLNLGSSLKTFDKYQYGNIVNHLSDTTNASIDQLNNKIDSVKGSKITVAKSSNIVQIRSMWNDANDIAIRTNLNGSGNGSFGLTGYYLVPVATDKADVSTGTLFKPAGDDICPANFNGSYRGGDHGDDRGYQITTSSAHGLTTANIGETWTDANNTSYVILQVPSTTTLLVCNPLNSGFYALGLVTPVSPLSKGGTSIAFSSVSQTQIKPGINHKSVKVVLSTGDEIKDNGAYNADYVDIVESYDIIYVPSMLTYLSSRIGSNDNNSLASDNITDKYCTVSIIYRFTERGAMTVFQSYDFVRSVGISSIGMIQSEKIGEYFCVPNTTYKTVAQQVGTQDILKASFTDANNPPNRYYQYFDAAQSKGMCLGYNTAFGTAKPATRQSVLTAGQYYSTFKMYPYVIGYYSPTPTTLTISNISYRVPLATYDTDIPSVGWYYVDDDIYLLLDIQKSVSKYLTLPKYMNGRKVEIVESFGSISVPEFVGANGLLITVDTYGSAVLKLTK